MKVAILGFGTVGQGIYSILIKKFEEFKDDYGLEFVVSSILVKDLSWERIPGTKHLYTNNMDDILATENLNIVFEAIGNENPPYNYLKKAIEYGCHVVTANKNMFSKYGVELENLAEKNGVYIGYEGTTAGSIPIIRSIRSILQVNEISRIQGILNGTSNYILTQMCEGATFEVALREARLKGYAEADCSDDISGRDALYKLKILSKAAFGKQSKDININFEGIDNITNDNVKEANKKGLRYRHIAEIERGKDGSILAKVGPQLIDIKHPFYAVDGVNNAVLIETNYSGNLIFLGPGAGMYPTASVMVEDCIDIIRKEINSTLVV
ncbi:homoserine dehydrogenase [Lysinibacillus sp. 54212]|uniref:homoserine dehydrogenase n=1 Tax=Lysinibacillus sp. 54212 TaxID=3119829 RepID=UPI002FC781AA